MFRARVVEDLPFLKRLRFREVYVASLKCQYVEELSVRVVGWRKPVGRALNSGTDVSAFRGWNPISNYRSPRGVDTFGPIYFFEKGSSPQELSIRPVQDVEEAVAIRLDEQFARRPIFFRINQYRRLICVVVIKIMRSELEIPA